MVIIRPHVTAVALFRRNGEVRLFASLGDAIFTLGYAWIKAHVGKNFRTFSHIDGLSGLRCLRKPTYREHEYVMRDDFGTPLTVIDFDDLHDRRWRSWLYCRNRESWNGVGPVPGTRKRRGGRYFFRNFSYMNAYRQSETFVEEGEVAPRAKRNVNNIPNDWDDFRCAAREDRNWKRYRMTRWK